MELTKNMTEILETLKIPRNVIELMEKINDISLIEDEENIIKIKTSSEVAYDLYCDGFLQNSTCEEVELLDILYSKYHENPYDSTYRRAGNAMSSIERQTFSTTSSHALGNLVCYLFTKVNDYKYSKLKFIEDVKEPIPLQVYIKLIDNSEKDIEVYYKEDETIYAGILDEIAIVSGTFGVKYYATIKIISKGKDKYIEGTKDIRIFPNSFVSSIEDLGLNIVTDEMKAELTEAGRHYVEITKNPKYCIYHGEAFSQGWAGDIRHRIDSRVMIDVAAFRLLNPRVEPNWYEGRIFYSDSKMDEVPEKLLWMCSPVVYGFSFNNKVWCKMYAKNIEEITFSENAFEDLIIPKKNKDIFVASLTHDMPSFDSISDKGAGKIFLLYGPPGVGKTMTAESVAEFLQKPLYYVSVGELGIRPEELENSLDKVMKVANSWDAIILLDEVDVFAVKRDGASIERNAMTAIFLRLLERYSGIMFMTTNLLNNLDDAFISRSTAIIKYEELASQDRAKIWLNLFDKVEKLNTIKLDEFLKDDIEELSSHNINGRVIKNTVRLAYSLALSKKESLSLKHIETALNLRQN